MAGSDRLRVRRIPRYRHKVPSGLRRAPALDIPRATLLRGHFGPAACQAERCPAHPRGRMPSRGLGPNQRRLFPGGVGPRPRADKLLAL
eukprot:9234010-Alexandrium_andersonii.AAC.1